MKYINSFFAVWALAALLRLYRLYRRYRPRPGTDPPDSPAAAATEKELQRARQAESRHIQAAIDIDILSQRVGRLEKQQLILLDKIDTATALGQDAARLESDLDKVQNRLRIACKQLEKAEYIEREYQLLKRRDTRYGY